LRGFCSSSYDEFCVVGKVVQRGPASSDKNCILQLLNSFFVGPITLSWAILAGTMTELSPSTPSSSGHSASHHSPTDGSPLCPICGREYSSKGNLRQHINNVHQQPQQWSTCNVCGKNFKTKHYLQNHKLYAHGQRQRTQQPPPTNQTPTSSSSSSQDPRSTFVQTFRGPNSSLTIRGPAPPRTPAVRAPVEHHEVPFYPLQFRPPFVTQFPSRPDLMNQLAGPGMHPIQRPHHQHNQQAKDDRNMTPLFHPPF